ncbi:hypothetical protein PEC301619_02840 [Pectobacterium carotovorum subsp. carotovorum]|nr:hypothetical protein PEC301619_02840 [Pectobacterium carotovorum subsp. carotovorum]GKW36920.1 hypothetical protein PEC301875_09440 [Pectobacterium carotovorum subsp. carotovorum]
MVPGKQNSRPVTDILMTQRDRWFINSVICIKLWQTALLTAQWIA